MKTLQQGGPEMTDHRCFVAYGQGFWMKSARFRVVGALLALAVFGFPSAYLQAEKPESVDDFAQVYVNQYFEADPSLSLSEKGKKKSEALARYFQGRSLEGKGRPMEAVEAYRKVLKNQPDQFFLARKTAYLLARSGQTDDAQAVLEESLKQNPDQPYAYISLSEFLATYPNDAERRKRSFEIIEEAAEKFPDEVAVYEHLVKLFVASGRRVEAREIIAKAAARENTDPLYWLRLGKITGQVWNAQKGAPVSDANLLNSIYGKALEHAGTNWGVVERVADYYHATSQFDRAISAYTSVIGANPDNLILREKLAATYGGKGDQEKLITTYEEIIEIDPENADYRKKLAGVYLRLERFKESIPHFVKAFEVTKGSKSEYNALGQMMLEQGEVETAIEFVNDAIAQYPETPEFPLLKARALSGLKKWEDAVDHFEQAEALAKKERPDLINEGFYFQYAAAHERTGDLDTAAELFRKTIAMISKNERSKMPDDVRYREFTATTYNYLGYMWLENGMNIDEAGELIKTAAELHPTSGAIADSLGWFHFVKGDYEAARVEMERSISLTEPEHLDGVIFDHMAQVQYALGEKEKAIEFMKKAVELSPDEEAFKKRLADFESGAPFKPFEISAKEAEKMASPKEKKAPEEKVDATPEKKPASEKAATPAAAE